MKVAARKRPTAAQKLEAINIVANMILMLAIQCLKGSFPRGTDIEEIIKDRQNDINHVEWLYLASGNEVPEWIWKKVRKVELGIKKVEAEMEKRRAATELKYKGKSA